MKLLNSELVLTKDCFMFDYSKTSAVKVQNFLIGHGGQGSTEVTHSPPTSEIRIQILGKPHVAYHRLAVSPSQCY